MGGKDSNFKMVYRSEPLEHFREGEWVFFQRSKGCGGGYWFGRTYAFYFWLEFGQPTSLAQVIDYLLALESIKPQLEVFDDDQFCLPF